MIEKLHRLMTETDALAAIEFLNQEDDANDVVNLHI